MQDVFIEPAGQDDNLGDSVLRAALMDAVRHESLRFHLHLDGQSSDYASGFRLGVDDVVHASRGQWLSASNSASKPVWLFNAGEWNLLPSNGFPGRRRARELRRVIESGGEVVVSGLGVRSPLTASHTDIDPVLLDAAVVSWRDHPSREATGFGSVEPDWAFFLGTPTQRWAPIEERLLLPVTLRFDRPWPEESWFVAVRALASRTGTQIVTVAQVSRDAPRAVELARALGGEYLVPPSLDHARLEVFVRSIYARSLAVVSDRAHGLIIGATEGAFPIGSATSAEKIYRMLDVAGLSSLTGGHGDFDVRTNRLEDALPMLAPAVDWARTSLDELAGRIRAVMPGIS